jgi:hypothetical protein
LTGQSPQRAVASTKEEKEEKVKVEYTPKDATLRSLFYLEIALHILGGKITHYHERKQLYLHHLVSVTPLFLPAATAAGRNNGVRNTKCCRYSCLRS